MHSSSANSEVISVIRRRGRKAVPTCVNIAKQDILVGPDEEPHRELLAFDRRCLEPPQANKQHGVTLLLRIDPVWAGAWSARFLVFTT